MTTDPEPNPMLTHLPRFASPCSSGPSCLGGEMAVSTPSGPQPGVPHGHNRLPIFRRPFARPTCAKPEHLTPSVAPNSLSHQSSRYPHPSPRATWSSALRCRRTHRPQLPPSARPSSSCLLEPSRLGGEEELLTPTRLYIGFSARCRLRVLAVTRAPGNNAELRFFPAPAGRRFGLWL